MDGHTASIRAAVQAMLDAEGDGYVVGQIVVCMSLERINSDGDMANIPWMWTPSDQAHWITTALLNEALSLEDSRFDIDWD